MAITTAIHTYIYDIYDIYDIYLERLSCKLVRKKKKIGLFF